MKNKKNNKYNYLINKLSSVQAQKLKSLEKYLKKLFKQFNLQAFS